MEWSKYEKFLAKRAARGRPTPAWESRPDLDDALLLAWSGFWMLHSQRQCGFSANALTFQAILECADYYDLYAFDDRDGFMFCVQTLDAHWMSLNLKNTKKGK